MAMDRTVYSISRWALVSLCALFATAEARAQTRPGAGLDACGNIYVEGQADCEVIPPGAQCEAQCDPISVEAVCALDLAADCRAECDKLPSVSCTGGCVLDCVGQCEVDPGEFDCETECGAECAGTCDGQCRASADRRECSASCEGSCSASCDSACRVDTPSAECEARCEASCDGACRVETNLDCQLDCQARARAACVTRLEGGCKVQCRKQEGALFCDGQYIDHGNNLQRCIDALKATLSATVRVVASGTSMCTGGTCTASGKVSSDCAVSAPGAGRTSSEYGVYGGLVLVAWLVRRRYRQRR
jgi:hypothetical protein